MSRIEESRVRKQLAHIVSPVSLLRKYDYLTIRSSFQVFIFQLKLRIEEEKFVVRKDETVNLSSKKDQIYI